MAAEYREAPEVQQIAQALIPQYHGHLASARIRYLFREGPWASRGRTVLGKAYKLGAREQHLVGADFLVVINADAWRELTPEQRVALVDHELSHCGIDDQGNWTLWEHDVEEFRHVLERHGFWQPNLWEFGQTAVRKAEQLSLFDAVDAGAREGAA